MPPGKKKLTPADVETLGQWIDAGAKTARAEPESLAAGDTFTDEERGALVVSADPPAAAAGRANSRTWSRTPIDAFLLARLESQGLSFGPAGRSRRR